MPGRAICMLDGLPGDVEEQCCTETFPCLLERVTQLQSLSSYKDVDLYSSSNAIRLRVKANIGLAIF